MTEEASGRVPTAPGSHPSGHAGCAVDGASRFDPSRIAVRLQDESCGYGVGHALLMQEAAQRIEELRGERQRLFEVLGVCLEALHTAKHGAEYDDELGEMIDSAIAAAREARKPYL